MVIALRAVGAVILMALVAIGSAAAIFYVQAQPFEYAPQGPFPAMIILYGGCAVVALVTLFFLLGASDQRSAVIRFVVSLAVAAVVSGLMLLPVMAPEPILALPTPIPHLQPPVGSPLPPATTSPRP